MSSPNPAAQTVTTNQKWLKLQASTVLTVDCWQAEPLPYLRKPYRAADEVPAANEQSNVSYNLHAASKGN
jgi:hypothetical protein